MLILSDKKLKLIVNYLLSKKLFHDKISLNIEENLKKQMKKMGTFDMNDTRGFYFFIP